jgi:mRNA interferase HigB
VHVISRKPFNDAILAYPNCSVSLVDLLNILEKKTFGNPQEMRKYIPSLDNFNLQKVFVKHIVLHAEYDRLTTYYRGHKE